MTRQLRARTSEPIIRVVEASQPPTIVIDLGDHDADVSTEVLDGTLIVVDEETDEQYEYSLPGEHRRTFMRNGVLTIEVDA